MRYWHCHKHSLGPPINFGGVFCKCHLEIKVHPNNNVCDFDFVFVPCNTFESFQGNIHPLASLSTYVQGSVRSIY